MKYIAGQKALAINVLNNKMAILTIEGITPSSIIKTKNDISFTEDGFPKGYKSYSKRVLIEPGEKQFFSWRLIDCDSSVLETLSEKIKLAHSLKI